MLNLLPFSCAGWNRVQLQCPGFVHVFSSACLLLCVLRLNIWSALLAQREHLCQPLFFYHTALPAPGRPRRTCRDQRFRAALRHEVLLLHLISSLWRMKVLGRNCEATLVEMASHAADKTPPAVCLVLETLKWWRRREAFDLVKALEGGYVCLVNLQPLKEAVGILGGEKLVRPSCQCQSEQHGTPLRFERGWGWGSDKGEMFVFIQVFALFLTSSLPFLITPPLLTCSNTPGLLHVKWLLVRPLLT